MKDLEIVQHPVMVQFVNLLRGIYESKDIPAMVVAVQVAQQVLMSSEFQRPQFEYATGRPQLEGVDPVTGEIL